MQMDYNLDRQSPLTAATGYPPLYLLQPLIASRVCRNHVGNTGSESYLNPTRGHVGVATCSLPQLQRLDYSCRHAWAPLP